MESLIGGISGTMVPILLKKMGLPMGYEGVEYYAQVHRSSINSNIHTVFMPFVIYGMLLWIPALFRLNKEKAKRLQRILYISYMTHYLQMNLKTGCIISLVYLVPLYNASNDYNVNFSLVKGLKISFGTLLIQEFFGHTHNSDAQSRLDVISMSNSVCYAIYYSIDYQLTSFKKINHF